MLGPGRVEVFIDSTRDQFRTQRWIHMLCEEVAEDASFDYGISETCREIRSTRLP